MKALISPRQTVEDGCYVVQVETQDFPVADPLFWVDCADDVVAYEYYYQTITQTILLIPVPEYIPPPVVPLSTTPDGGADVLA